jgi:hypothetical protein
MENPLHSLLGTMHATDTVADERVIVSALYAIIEDV